MIPLALYIHIPWCAKKCPYCDFNSHPARGQIPEAEYVQALLRDLEFELASAPEARPLSSIFFGGGTPSLFSGAGIGAILNGVAQRLAFAPGIEITLEANPGTAEAQRFHDYRAAGVNRLSMGVQSLNDRHLKALGRIHGAEEARAAVAMARAAGLANLNLDLMFALPEQTLAEAEADLRGLLALAPEHLSYYHLTLEPNTEFAAKPPKLPDSDLAYEMLEQGQALLEAAGYAQYETSAYALPGRTAAHNLNYWRFGDYLSIGAGAHGKRTLDGQVLRRARHKHPKTFMETAGSAAGVQEERAVDGAELAFEYVLNTLRLHEGFALSDFRARTGLADAALEPSLGRMLSKGLLERDGEVVRPTVLGRNHLNTLQMEFLPS
ncbi:MAG: radical SAM family heme chaperone HemW [Nevskiaceae bacterium]|nr:MAG: radical SAM family heme chaperone HemW [Nevskiaceae bacterium]TAM32280.1 MAG: radical SAM family heme chaperone HemW [Nevskiaceae bacterium]